MKAVLVLLLLTLVGCTTVIKITVVDVHDNDTRTAAGLAKIVENDRP